MVSSEGACAAYYLYRRLRARRPSPRGRPPCPDDGPPQASRPRLRGLVLPAAAAGQPEHRDGRTAAAAQLSAELIEHLFVPAFGDEPAAGLADSAVVTLGGVRIAFSTDTFVVRPLFFPGGSHRRPGGERDGQRPGHERGRRRPTCPAGSSSRRARSCRWSAGSPRTWATRRGRPGSPSSPGDTKVVDAGHGDGSTSTRPASAWCPTGVDIAPAAGRGGRRGARQRRDRRARDRDHERPRGAGVRHRRWSATARAAARPGRGHARRRPGPARAARPHPRRRWAPR